MFTKFLSIGFWMAVVVLATSCSSNPLVNQWRAEDAGAVPYHKVLVIGISDQEGMRRTFEDVFTQRLLVHGVATTPGYRLLPSVVEKDQRKLLEAVADSGADAVLMSRVVKVDNRTYYVPGYYPGPAFGFYGYYSPVWFYYEPPRLEHYRVVTLETNLWDLGDRSLVWSGTTRTFNPGEARKEASELAEVIVGALEKEALIKSSLPKEGK